MQLSDIGDKKGLIQDCEFRTGLGDTAISGNAAMLDHFVRLINSRYQQVVTTILQSQDEWDWDDINHTDYPIVTTPLVADQRDYSLTAAEKVLKIKRVDVCYSGTSSTCYKAEPIDSGEMATGLGYDAETDGRFSKTAPRYDLQYNSIFLYPRANAADVTNGGVLRVEWTREIDEFTDSDTTQEPGIDEAFHPMLSIGASLDWAIAKGDDRKADLQALYNDYEARLVRYYGDKQEDRRYAMVSDFINYY